MSNIVLKDRNGVKNTYSNVEVIRIADSDGNYNDYVTAPKIVDVPEPITSNGTYTADRFGGDGIGKFTVDVPTTLSISTELEMNALLATAEVGSVYKYVGATTGTYENGALYVVESVTLITFTINGITHQAIEGMTWGDWVDSEYNTIQAVDEKSDGIWSTLYEANITLNNMSVFWNDPIVANESYSCG